MLINDRFEVDPLRNEITDRQTGKTDRIEPRLMKLLCLLAENEGKTVSREIIVKEIWNDYPGGNEGLNQAISVLRKLLNDDKKRIIETLPKAGYCFHGTSNPGQPVVKRKSVKVIYLATTLFLLLIIVFIIIYNNYRVNDKIVHDRLPGNKSEAFKLDSLAKLDGRQNSEIVKMDSAGKLDSKQRINAFRMDSLGKADRKESVR